MQKRTLVIMCDYGLDDAIATCDLLAHSKNFRKIDIIAVAGNVPAEVSLRNARTLLSKTGFDDRITLVDTTAEPQNFEELYDIHGSDGMGGLFPPTACDVTVKTFADWLADYKGCDALLSLGPMTLTEKILRKAEPREFIFMAGNVADQPNYKGYEFNEGIDPNAFAQCVRHAHKAVTLDIGCPALDVQRLDLAGEDVFHRLLKRYQALGRERKETSSYVYDDIAVLCLLYPERFITKTETDPNGNVVRRLIYTGAAYLD